MIGYRDGIQTLAGTFTDAYFGAVGVPTLGPEVISKTTTYMQQNVNPWLESYLVAGIAMAVVGLILVVRGDPKPKSAKQPESLQGQTPAAKQQQ
jgi:hypothetical protein